MKYGNIESNVSYYNLHFPETFVKAKDEFMYSQNGEMYIDFFAAAGSLNYGHNNNYIKSRMLDYMAADNIIQALDMDTVAKEEFLNCFERHILKKKDLKYKVQFCGPTGTNAVEAALKLARKITGRQRIFALSGSFHGMTTGSLAVSSTKAKHNDYWLGHCLVNFIPYTIDKMKDYDPIAYIEYLLENEHSGIDIPAAIILETIQAEGGVIVLSVDFLRKIQDICEKYNVLFICDDIQVGCYRTGTFFSFEDSNIEPDMITLSKSISGYGLPMALLLMKPGLDIWESGEHNGTFRANQLALVGAKAALEYAERFELSHRICCLSEIVKECLEEYLYLYSGKIQVRGKGLIWGIDLNNFNKEGLGERCSKECFKNGLIIETCGNKKNVLKIMPPLIIKEDNLLKGMEIIKKCIAFEIDKLGT